VSIKTCVNCFFIASSTALYATDAGSEPCEDLIISTSIFLAQFSNCSIAAALKVSDAEKITLLPLDFNIFPIFPIVVVFPTPLTPETRIAFKSVLFLKNFRFPMETLNQLYNF